MINLQCFLFVSFLDNSVDSWLTLTTLVYHLFIIRKLTVEEKKGNFTQQILLVADSLSCFFLIYFRVFSTVTCTTTMSTFRSHDFLHCVHFWALATQLKTRNVFNCRSNLSLACPIIKSIARALTYKKSKQKEEKISPKTISVPCRKCNYLHVPLKLMCH